MEMDSDKRLEDIRLEDVAIDGKERQDGETFIDPVAEKKLLRKIDFRVIPALWLLFLMAFLDRTNIGNARIQGLTEVKLKTA